MLSIQDTSIRTKIWAVRFLKVASQSQGFVCKVTAGMPIMPACKISADPQQFTCCSLKRVARCWTALTTIHLTASDALHLTSLPIHSWNQIAVRHYHHDITLCCLQRDVKSCSRVNNTRCRENNCWHFKSTGKNLSNAAAQGMSGDDNILITPNGILYSLLRVIHLF